MVFGYMSADYIFRKNLKALNKRRLLAKEKKAKRIEKELLEKERMDSLRVALHEFCEENDDRYWILESSDDFSVCLKRVEIIVAMHIKHSFTERELKVPTEYFITFIVKYKYIISYLDGNESKELGFFEKKDINLPQFYLGHEEDVKWTMESIG